MSIDFSKAILKHLILNKEQAFSLTQLHNEIMEKNPEWNLPNVRSANLASFKRAFLTIEKEYDNVYRRVHDGRQYLIWSSDRPSSLKTGLNSAISKEIEEIDYDNFVEDFVKKGEYDFLSEDYFIDGINTGIHLLVKSGKVDQLSKLNMVHKIDWSAPNKEGKTPIQIAKAVKDVNMVEFLTKVNLDLTISELKSSIDKQKVINREILDRKLEMEKQNKSLISKNSSLESDIFIHKMVEAVFLLILAFLFWNWL